MPDLHAPAPTHVGPYRLLSQLGAGGMGVVHLALGPGDRAVAVKLLRPEIAADETGRARFAQEVAALQGVRGRNIAEVLDADVAWDPPYVVTRYVPGPRLDEVVQRHGPLDGDGLLRLGRGLAEALRDIHGAGVVHRDLKPGNVLLVDGEPVVIDFGIARRLDDPTLTLVGLFVGTPGYLAPEILSGSRATAASDVFAWGATMAYAATGRPPFGRGPVEDILERVSEGEPDLDGVPERLAPLLRWTVSRRAEERPSAEQLTAAVEALRRLATLPAAPVEAVAPPTRAYTLAAAAVQPAWSPPAPPPAPPAPSPSPPIRRPRTGAPPHAERHGGRTTLLALLALGLVAGLGALAPGAVAALLFVVLVLLHAVYGSARAQAVRRWRRGQSGWDPALLVAGLPWQVVRGALVTLAQGLLTVPLALAGAAIAIALATGVDRSTVLATGGGAGALTLAFTSFGLPGGAEPRRAAAWLARPALRRPDLFAVACLVLAALDAVVLVAAAASAEPDWWPFSHADLRGVIDALRGSVG